MSFVRRLTNFIMTVRSWVLKLRSRRRLESGLWQLLRMFSEMRFISFVCVLLKKFEY